MKFEGQIKISTTEGDIIQSVLQVDKEKDNVDVNYETLKDKFIVKLCCNDSRGFKKSFKSLHERLMLCYETLDFCEKNDQRGD